MSIERTQESTPAQNGKPISSLSKWLWRPNLIVFVSSACIMVLELVAGRIIAPYVGVSLYTWTSVIGVVLAGISLGNFLGGQIADRWASLRLLGGIFSLGGLLSLVILTVDKVNSSIALENLTRSDLSLILSILILTAILFLLPCTVLGMISPIVAKLAMRDLAQAGRTVGGIYAAGSIGSIVGTFLTGFVLISWFGTHRIVWGVATILVLLGLIMLLQGRRGWLITSLVAVLAASVLLGSQTSWLQGTCTRETNYFCIRVEEETKDGEEVRVLLLDRLVHSYTSLNNPTKLVYDYERAYASISAYKIQQNPQARALFIGGGGYTLPRYLEALYSDTQIDVIEIDPGVTEIAHQMLGLARDTRIVSHNQDARLYLEQKPTQTYDLVFGDAFNDFSVPYHLTTREFDERVRAWLREDGYYVVNIIDGAGAKFLRAFAYTLRQTFRYVYLAPSIETWREASRSTFVLIAGDVPLDFEALGSVKAPGAGEIGDKNRLAQQIYTQEQLDALLMESPPVMLTDRYAPVDQMLASVFLDQIPE
jgi:spermidine synthase